MSDSLDLMQAADYLKIHEDTCARLTKAGEIPGCKIGRKWVYDKELLQKYLRDRCQSTEGKVRPIGGSASVSLAQKLAARRAQRIAGKQKNLKSQKKNDSGDSTNSGTVVRLDGQKLQRAG